MAGEGCRQVQAGGKLKGKEREEGDGALDCPRDPQEARAPMKVEDGGAAVPLSR